MKMCESLDVQSEWRWFTPISEQNTRAQGKNNTEIQSLRIDHRPHLMLACLFTVVLGEEGAGPGCYVVGSGRSNPVLEIQTEPW